MKIELIAQTRGGNPNVYQIDGKDLVDIGNNSLKDIDFDASNVSKIAITEDDFENIGHLHLFPYKEQLPKIGNADEEAREAFPKKVEMGNPSIIAPELSETPSELNIPANKVEDGEKVQISGYNFRVFVHKHVYSDGSHTTNTAYYNEEEKILFSGNILEAAKLHAEEGSISREETHLLKILQDLEIEELYPGHRSPLKGQEARKRLEEIAELT